MIDLPARAAWSHQDARVGYEVLFLHREPDGYGFDGHATAVEDGAA